MKIKTFPKNAYPFFVIGIILFGLFVLWPSFNLALTGDDYLGLWRYYYHINGDVGRSWNSISYFFTSYGPEDMGTALIYSFFKHNALPYYIISFILRLLASFSFIPLIYYLTKNRAAAFLSGLFFVVSATGLETTDWSFNMPSYVSLSIFNIFLLTYVKAKDNKKYKLLLLSGVLFFLTIVIQPIRMTGLPFFVGLLFVFNLITGKTKDDIKYSFLAISVTIVSFLTIFLVGNSLGAQTNVDGFKERIKVTLGNRLESGNLEISNQIKQGNYYVFLYPIVQTGSIIFPSDLIPNRFLTTQNHTKLLLLTVLSLVFYSVVLSTFQKYTYGFKKKTFLINILCVASVVSYFWISFSNKSNLQISNRDYYSFLSGIYILSLVTDMFFRNYKDDLIRRNLYIVISWLFSSFLLVWFAAPFFVHITTGRYLITASSALAMALGIVFDFLHRNTQSKISLFYLSIPVLVFLFMHVVASRMYLSQLSELRPRILTQETRSKFPKVQSFGKTKDPIVIYFMTDNSAILYHRLLFGFPVTMSFYQNFNYWSNIAYTESWNEVISAYTDGKSLKRFSIPQQKTKIENIYSFLLRDEKIIDTTETTRSVLESLYKNNL